MDAISGLLKRLSRSGYVDGVALIGSAAGDQFRLESDYDVLIVLDQPPVPVRTGVTWVDGRLTDLVFSTVEEIDGLAVSDRVRVNADEIGESIVTWMSAARIMHDRRGRLGRLVERVGLLESGSEPDAGALENVRLRRLDRASYNLVQTRRTVAADDEVYQGAVDLRMLYQLADLMVDYFSVRGLNWRGEKAAIRFWRAEDPRYWELFRRCMDERDRAVRVGLYGDLVRATMKPAGEPWTEGITAFTLPSLAELTRADLDVASRFWEQLIE